MSDQDKPTVPAPGPWVQRWLSRERHAVWLRAGGSDERVALELYEWNAQLSAAAFRDLSHLEVGLRNAYDRALSAHGRSDVHWTRRGHELFAPLYRTRKGRRVDVTAGAATASSVRSTPREDPRRHQERSSPSCRSGSGGT